MDMSAGFPLVIDRGRRVDIGERHHALCDLGDVPSHCGPGQTLTQAPGRDPALRDTELEGGNVVADAFQIFGKVHVAQSVLGDSALSSTFCASLSSRQTRAVSVNWADPPNLRILSLPVRKHVAILRSLLIEKGVSQGKVAEALGLKSPSAAGMKLRKERGFSREQLEIMCELAGITIIALAAMSDDLHLAKRPEAIEGAVILDDLDAADMEAAMLYLRHMKAAKLAKK